MSKTKDPTKKFKYDGLERGGGTKAEEEDWLGDQLAICMSQEGGGGEGSETGTTVGQATPLCIAPVVLSPHAGLENQGWVFFVRK